MASKKTFFGGKEAGKTQMMLYQKVGGGRDKPGVTTNVQGWIKDWKDSRILLYGDPRFHTRLMDLHDNPVVQTLEEELAEFADVTPLPEDPRHFVLSEEQAIELAALPNNAARATRTREFENEWILLRMTLNTTIKSNNDVNKVRKGIIVKRHGESEHKNSEVWGAVVSSMEPDSLNKVKAFVIGLPGQVNYMTFEIAQTTWNWLFLFQAAEQTHLLLSDLMDPITREQRKRQEMLKLEGMKMGTTKLEKWITSLEDQFVLVGQCGYVLTEFDKVHIFMTNLNTTLFEAQIKLWVIPSQRTLPENYERVKEIILGDYSAMCVSQPELINKVYSASNNWKSFASKSLPGSEESKSEYNRIENGQRACFICGAFGKAFHSYGKCPKRNDKFTPESNRKYFENGKKMNVSNKGKGKNVSFSGVDNASTSTKEEFKVATCRLISIADLDIEEQVIESEPMELFKSNVTTFCRYGISEDEIDFVIDNASETGVIRQQDVEFLDTMFTVKSGLKGVGDTPVTSKYAGNTIFGDMYVVSKCDDNLISEYNVEKLYVVYKVEEGWWRITGKVGTHLEGVSWDFKRDEKRYLDLLLHLTVSRENLTQFRDMYKIATSKVYRPDISDHKSISDFDNIAISRVEQLHVEMNHMSADSMERLVSQSIGKSVFNVSTSDIKLWKEVSGKFCTGCLGGKMLEHSHVSSAKVESFKPGERGYQDLFFVETIKGVTEPKHLHVDAATGMSFITNLKHKNVDELQKAQERLLGEHQRCNLQLKCIVSDREPALISLRDWLQSKGVQLSLKAAGQHEGHVENKIRRIKETCRAVKHGVRDTCNYTPPAAWNQWLLQDVITTMNIGLMGGQRDSPFEKFTGKTPDYYRSVRYIAWGIPILAKAPKKGVYTGINTSNAQWVVPVYRLRDGIVMVYGVETGKYAYRFKFAHVKTVPQWVTEKLRAINPDSLIGFDDSDMPLDEMRMSVGEDGVSTDFVSGEDLTTNEAEELALEHLEDGELRGEDTAVLHRMYEDQIRQSTEVPTLEEVYLPMEVDLEAELNGDTTFGGGRYPVRVRKAPDRLVVNCLKVLMTKVSTKGDPEARAAALSIELDNFDRKDVMEPVLESTLSAEEKRLILRSMANFVDKFDAEGNRIKTKARIVARGDLQFEECLGETSGQVCRIQSVFILMCIAVVYVYVVFTVDFVSAYLNTIMPDEVKHRHLVIQPMVAKVLLAKNHSYWSPYVRGDGSILVKLKKLIYGFKEAAYYWYVILKEALEKAGFLAIAADPCVFSKRTTEFIIHTAITVDDCFGVSSNEQGKLHFIEVCRAAFVEVTVKEGDELEILGLKIKFFRGVDARCEVDQKGYIIKVLSTKGKLKKKTSPSAEGLFEEHVDSPLLANQTDYMKAIGELMFAANRTYAEIRMAVNYLSTKFGKATEADQVKLTHVLEYLNEVYDDHKLCFKPRSLEIIAAADASYGVHSDGKSQTGGCVGFRGEGDSVSYYDIVAGKQPVTAKSTFESELISQSTVGDSVVWGRYVVEQLGYTNVCSTLMQDNKSAIIAGNRGSGTWRRTKHIHVRFFWLADLIKEGILRMVYTSTLEMVADILTKPLHGEQFKRLRAKLLGW